MKKLVSLLLAVALLFAQAMPAFAVDEVAPASAENVYVLDAAEHLELMSGGTKTDGDTAVVGPDGYFTIHFSVKSKIDASTKVFDDGYEGTQRLNLQGKAQVDPNGITKNVVEFTTDGPGSVTIWWVLAGEERQMGIFDTEGNLVSQTETTLEKNQTCVSTLEIPTAGTYFIGGVTGNNYIFRLEVTVASEDAPIAPAPTIADGKYVISWNGLTFSALAEDRVYGYPYAGDVNALTDTDYITVTNVTDGQFTMQDSYGRYIYLKGLYNSFNVSAEMPTEGYLWVLEEAEGGLLLKNVLKEKYIGYNENYASWGCYVNISASSILTVAGAAQGTPQESTTLPDLDCPLWWSAFTDGIEITESGVTITCVTTAYPEATNYWNGMNWLLYTANTPVVNGSGYAEYWMQRSDNYGWSTSLNVNCFSGADALAVQGVTYTSSCAEDFSWESFLAALQAGTNATVTAKLEGTNAVVTTEVAGITSMVTMPVDTDKPVYLSLTGEQSTLTDIVVTTSGAEPTPTVIASGTCGENLTWTLTDDGILTISGTGDMYHCESSSDVPWDDYRLQITTAIVEDGVTSIGNYAFVACHELSSVTIPKGVTSIGDMAFAECLKLKNVTIPDGVTIIGFCSFAWSSNLESVTIPDSVTTIANQAFYQCYSLQSITFPANVTEIGYHAFYECSSLTEVYFEGDAPSDSYYTFDGIIATAYYPADNDTWTEDVMQDYGGTITWVAYGEEPADPETDTLLQIGDVTAQAGETIEVPIYLSGNTGFSYLRLALEFDSDIFEFVSATNGTVAVEDFTSGKNLLWVETVDTMENGLLVTLTFLVKEDVAEGDYTIGAEVKECYNESYADVSMQVASGTVTIVNIMYGDVNGDGKVDGRDLLKLKRYLANYDDETGTSTEEITAGADVNGDGKVDGRDLLKLKRYLANYDDETGTSTETLGPQN